MILSLVYLLSGLLFFGSPMSHFDSRSPWKLTNCSVSSYPTTALPFSYQNLCLDCQTVPANKPVPSELPRSGSWPRKEDAARDLVKATEYVEPAGTKGGGKPRTLPSSYRSCTSVQPLEKFGPHVLPPCWAWREGSRHLKGSAITQKNRSRMDWPWWSSEWQRRSVSTRTANMASSGSSQNTRL